MTQFLYWHEQGFRGLTSTGETRSTVYVRFVQSEGCETQNREQGAGATRKEARQDRQDAKSAKNAGEKRDGAWSKIGNFSLILGDLGSLALLAPEFFVRKKPSIL